MRRILFLLLLTLAPALVGVAQTQADFAAHFLQTVGDQSRLSTTTVSPAMMERILELGKQSQPGRSQDFQRLAQQVRTVRVVSSTAASDAEELHQQALRLMRKNARRYTDASDGRQRIFVRQRGKRIVEVVLLSRTDSCFTIFDLTGEMNRNFLSELQRL